MIASTIAEEIAARFPLFETIRFVTRDASEPGESPPSVLGVLLSAATRREPGSICVVLPKADAIAFSAACITAFQEIKKEFHNALSDRLINQLVPGQKVAVLPHELVYLFKGYCEYAGQQYIKLQILGTDSPRRRRGAAPVAEPEYRTLPRSEIGRLRLTEHVSPAGKANSDLGQFQKSALDRLLGIESGGNTSLFTNNILLAAPRAGTEELSDEISVRIEDAADDTVVPIADLLTLGKIVEDGSLTSSDRYQAQDEPLMAVSHSIDNVAAACEIADPGTKTVFVEGASIIRNLQAFDRIADRQRIVVIAEECEWDEIDALAARGCSLWVPSPSQLQLIGDAGAQRDKSVFASYKRGVFTSASESLESVLMEEPYLDEAALHLENASRVFRGDPNEDGAKEMIAPLYRLLMEASEWFGHLSDTERADVNARLGTYTSLLQRKKHWIPETACTDLESTVRCLKAAASDTNTGRSKADKLFDIVANLDALSSRILVAARKPAAVRRVEELFANTGLNLPVFCVSALPDESFDALIIGAWPGGDLIKKVLGRFLSPRTITLTHRFERRWFDQFNTNRQKVRAGLRARSCTADVLNLKTQLPASTECNTAVATSVSISPPWVDFDKWARTTRKGSPVQGVQSEELRDARYVGFVGNSYAYLTEYRALPVITDLIQRRTPKATSIPRRCVADLKVGDVVLFRDLGERDVVALFAEELMGREEYAAARKIADLWRQPLRRISPSNYSLQRKLAEAGLDRTAQTIRNWLYNEELIGPAEKSDLEIIARVSNDPELLRSIDSVAEAQASLRSAHMAAGYKLTQYLLDHLPNSLSELSASATQIDLGYVTASIVQIDDISERTEQRLYSEVNRLLTDES